MDIDRVRYLCIFSETGSLVKASEVLRISQPALSKAFKVLEDEVGFKILEADGRGLKLTEQGKKFVKEAKPLLSQWQSIASQIRNQPAPKTARVGSFEVFSTHFLGRMLEFGEFEDLELHELTPGKLEQAIIDGRVDFGITYLPIPRQGLELLETGKVRMGVFGLKSRFAGKELKSLPFAAPISPVEGTPSKVAGLDGWPDHKHERTIRYRVTMMESALELCRRGLAVAYLPKFVVDLQNQTVRPEFQLSELPAPVAREERVQKLFLVKPQSLPETPLIKAVAKALRSLS